MLIALILICSTAITPDLRECTRENASSVMVLPVQSGNLATCFIHGQAYLAHTSIGRELSDNERIKVVCVRSKTVDVSRPGVKQQRLRLTRGPIASSMTGSSTRRNLLADLTPREFEILSLLACGKPYGQIAEELSVSYKTVVNMSSQLKQKLDARNLPDLVRIAVQLLSATPV